MEQTQAGMSGGGAMNTAAAGGRRSARAMVVADVNSRQFTNDMTYQLIAEKKIVSEYPLGSDSYVVEEPLPQIDWKIESGTKSIGKYSCQKATGWYGGRHYTAWYTTELPFQNGPWKLWGLPGLILEAYDAKNEIQFLFKEISRDQDDYFIPGAIRPIKVAEEQFVKAKKNYQSDPVGAAMSKSPDGSVTPMLVYIDSTGKSIFGDAAKAALLAEISKPFNNPMELKKNR